MQRQIFIGYDAREIEAYLVTRASAVAHCSSGIGIQPLLLERLRAMGLYNRPTSLNDGRLWDDISEAPMATEFAISRFLCPVLSEHEGWSLFMDGDFLIRDSLDDLFDQYCDPSVAVYCVKHTHQPGSTVKMDGQAQLLYSRKNWSSFMLFNNEHPSNKKLTPELVNSLPGRDLHAFCWLDDSEIGALPQEWNFLVGYTKLDGEPKAVHFTEGAPCFPGYESQPYADEFRDTFARFLLNRG